jgi:hypothetical protein
MNSSVRGEKERSSTCNTNNQKFPTMSNLLSYILVISFKEGLPFHKIQMFETVSSHE